MSGGPAAKFLILGHDDIQKALPMAACIDLMATTMAVVSQGKAALPLRMAMPIPATPNRLGVMPGYLAEPAALGAKLICLYPDNPGQGLSSHTGVVTLFDPVTGQLSALLDAAAITALRTPAATAAASRVLARPGADDLAMVGTGEQALAHLEALSIAHNLRRVRVWGRRRERAQAFVDGAQARYSIPLEVAESVQACVAGADIVCTATASNEPVLQGAWLSPGTHVNLVGSSVQSASEIDLEGVVQSSYFVDYRPSALAQAGELKRAIDAGLIDESHIQAEIGQVHLGTHPGRRSEDEITIYKSLGVAAQDLAAAHAVLTAARAQGFGVEARL